MCRHVFLLLFVAACGGPPSGATKGATTFVLVPKRVELDRREHPRFHHDTHGRMVDDNDEPLLGYCKEKCKYVIPPGRSVVGCRETEMTEEVKKAFNIEDGRALMVCEIK